MQPQKNITDCCSCHCDCTTTDKISMEFKAETLDQIAELVRIDADSPEAEALIAAAGKHSRSKLGTDARLWCAIGIDYKPCSQSCQFCSFAHKWATNLSESTLDHEEVVKWSQYFIDNGAGYIVLRTSEDYPVEDLYALGRSIRAIAPPDLKIVANTRELTFGQAVKLKESGFDGIYKAIRLREGIDTQFNVAKRFRVIEKMQDAGLIVFSLLEPVGPEHTPEEIAQAIINLRDVIRPTLSGVMARVPVKATPLGHLPQISDRELAKLTAIVVLALIRDGSNTDTICSHPPIKGNIDAGANAVVVEVGAIPRDEYFSQKEWQCFTVKEAHDLLRSGNLSI